MNELYLLQEQLITFWESIPRYNRNNNIPCEQMDEYQSFFDKFMAYSKGFFGDDNITYAQVNDKIIDYTANQVKEILQSSDQEIFDSLSGFNEVQKHGLQQLEYCVNNYGEEDFYEDDSDNKFFSKFDKKDIDRFKGFQDFLRNADYSKKTSNK